MNILKKFLTCFAVVVVLWALCGGVSAGEVEKININTASVEELTKLDKVGPKYAQKIVEYREKNGLFKQPQDIMNVKGIGQKVYELNKERIVVEKTGKPGKTGVGS